MSELQPRMMVLLTHPLSSDLDQASRRWRRALLALEENIPGLESPQLGVCFARARGPARYYGSEERAACTWLLTASEQGLVRTSVGIADGFFTAQQAAHADEGSPGVRSPAPGLRIVHSANTATFLGTLPVATAATTELSEVFAELGIRTLGQLAALPEAAVHERFGNQGLEAHRLASGLPPRRSAASSATRTYPEHRTTLSCESPLDDSEQLAFANRTHADDFLRTLAKQGLVCTEIRIELIDDADTIHARNWAHPMSFTSMDIINRIRWQVAEIPQNADRSGAGITETVLIAARVARAADHESGLWNTTPDERIHHHMTRLQNLLGYEGVCIGVLSGGRLSDDRQQLLPWGSSPASRSQIRAPDLPWPGHITGLPPSTVFTEPPTAALVNAHGSSVHIDHEDFLTADPAFFSPTGETTAGRIAPVAAWSKPWPLTEQWWLHLGVPDSSHRLQLLLQDGTAWLVRYQQSTASWRVEARYD